MASPSERTHREDCAPVHVLPMSAAAAGMRSMSWRASFPRQRSPVTTSPTKRLNAAATKPGVRVTNASFEAVDVAQLTSRNPSTSFSPSMLFMTK